MNPYYSPVTSTDPLSQFLNAVATNWILALALLILIFFLVREIVCWYWKINNMVDKLEDIDRHLLETNYILRRAFPEPERIIIKQPMPIKEEPKIINKPQVVDEVPKEHWWNKKI